MRILLVILLLASPIFGQGKKLIQYGWDSPDPAYIRKHLKAMETSPFDGIMLTVRPNRGEGKLGGMDSLGWMVFRDKPFTPDMYEHAIEDLHAAKSAKFTDHFIAVMSHPAEGFDWFDDKLWPTVTHNIGCLAKVAKASGCAGLMFDPEEYNYPLWSYGRFPEPQWKVHTYEETLEKVRDRGRSFMRAINAEFPDVNIVTLFGPYIYVQCVKAAGEGKAAEANYSLICEFYDGMIEAATKETTLVDGYEQSYSYKAEQQFIDSRKRMLEEPRAMSKVPQAFAEHVRCGFGIWLDYDSGTRKGWFPDEPAKNHFSPAEFQSAVHFALKHSDKYVWIYNERALWWDKRPGGRYENAMITAKVLGAPQRTLPVKSQKLPPGK